MERLAGCPRCGQVLAGEHACPRCGVIFAKLRPREAMEAARDPAPVLMPVDDEPARAPMPWALIVGFAGLLIAGVVGLPKLRSGPPAPGANPGATEPALPRADDAARYAAVATADMPAPPTEAALPFESIAIPAEAAPGDPDEARFAGLARALNAGQPMGGAEVQAAEDLLARKSADKTVRDLLVAVLMRAAAAEKERRRYVHATAHLDRAATVEPANVGTWILLTRVSLDAGDWSRAEASARAAIALDARQADAWQGLGYALMRQDRNTEAAEALRAAADIRPDGATQALLDRVMAGLANESGMREQQLSHFHVRYDGAAHEAVGREILRALERHYATLAGSLDHQPQVTIPVILFTREGYYNANGAPAWSGGNYDNIDGRIRIPIGGLGAGLTPDMDTTLIHELTHAFVADRTRGTAPRDIHEGLAQYMEGKRMATESAQEIQWLADGRLQGVHGFYLGALCFVEYLVTNRGMGGMNDLLKAMGETGNADEAFRQVHGDTHRGVQKAWRQRLRQQYGS